MSAYAPQSSLQIGIFDLFMGKQFRTPTSNSASMRLSASRHTFEPCCETRPLLTLKRSCFFSPVFHRKVGHSARIVSTLRYDPGQFTDLCFIKTLLL